MCQNPQGYKFKKSLKERKKWYPYLISTICTRVFHPLISIWGSIGALLSFLDFLDEKDYLSCARHCGSVPSGPGQAVSPQASDPIKSTVDRENSPEFHKVQCQGQQNQAGSRYRRKEGEKFTSPLNKYKQWKNKLLPRANTIIKGALGVSLEERPILRAPDPCYSFYFKFGKKQSRNSTFLSFFNFLHKFLTSFYLRFIGMSISNIAISKCGRFFSGCISIFCFSFLFCNA